MISKLPHITTRVRPRHNELNIWLAVYLRAESVMSSGPRRTLAGEEHPLHPFAALEVQHFRAARSQWSAGDDLHPTECCDNSTLDESHRQLPHRALVQKANGYPATVDMLRFLCDALKGLRESAVLLGRPHRDLLLGWGILAFLP
jgi:hypothetical protein